FGTSIDSMSDYDVDATTAGTTTIEENLSGNVSSSSAYAIFSINVQDFSYTQESADTVNRILDIHETYNVPVDIYLTNWMTDIYEDETPELLERLKTSSVAVVDYHTRPPLPYYWTGLYDHIGLADMNADERYEAIMNYETHGLDLATGDYTSEEGGYAYLKEVMGYAPPVASLLGSGDIAQSGWQVFSDLGATFTVSHDETLNLGEKKGVLYARPEHVDLKLFEHVGEDADDVLDEAFDDALAAEDGVAPYFIGIKMHDNDFFAEDSAWTTVYQSGDGRDGPPYPTTLTSDLLSDADKDAMWDLYEETVAAVAARPTTFIPIDSFDLLDLVGE
ncbi:MAG: hypothetical protein AAB839_02975, partial [Patescibacteria group bacterium]